MAYEHMRQLGNRGRRYPALLSLALGALSATGFAPFGFWPLALACFGGWIWLVHESPTLKQALLRGWLFGLGQFAVGNNWLQHPFAFQDAMPQWLGYVGVVLASCYLAIYTMLAAGLAWRFASPRSTGDARTPPGAGYVLVFGAAWIVTEWLRGTMLGGYPWNPLGAIWVPMLPIARTAALVGTYALSGLTTAFAGSLMLAIARRWRLLAAMLTIGALAALLNIGHKGSPAAGAAYPHIRIVQPNLGEEERPTPDYAENNLRALESLAGEPGAHPRLIVWPEGALRYSIEDGYPPYVYGTASPAMIRQRIAAKLGPRDILLTGGNALQFDARGDVRAATNSIFALDSRGSILARYDKAHLVPFGEYLPLRPILTAIGLSRLVPGDIDFADGPGPRTIALPGFGTVGMQICYEIIFSGQVTDPAHRPALIFNPSNDSWFGTWGPPQHLAQARLRAIEEGIPIIRATPTGISAVIDADGRLLDSVGLHRAGAIELAMPEADPPTLFSRLGNWMALITAAMMLLVAVAIRRAAR
ncbi:apolipoprotein N-acyltransferase [Sphingomonas oligophenolica]|uniref:Apolipoprotein N-acyltransferase n=1 Tax=Sphingomonas oligophenolica TaxID=301154 RepID=A0ABU9Y8R5_9SPHN